MWISLSTMIPVSKLVPPMSPSRTRFLPIRLASSLAPIAPPAGPEPSRPSGYCARLVEADAAAEALEEGQAAGQARRRAASSFSEVR